MFPEGYRSVGSRSKPLLLEETVYLFRILHRNVRERLKVLIHSMSSLVSGASFHALPFILWWFPSGFVGAGDAHANARSTSLSGLAQPQSQPRSYHNDHATTSNHFIYFLLYSSLSSSRYQNIHFALPCNHTIIRCHFLIYWTPCLVSNIRVEVRS